MTEGELTEVRYSVTGRQTLVLTTEYIYNTHLVASLIVTLHSAVLPLAMQ